MTHVRATIPAKVPTVQFQRCAGVIYEVAPDGSLRRLGLAEGTVSFETEARLHVAVTEPAALPRLAALGPERIVSLDVHKTHVTDGQLAALAAFDGLESLNLSKARAVGDEGVAALRGLVRLADLDLYQTALTDAGLEYLTGLTELRRLHLGGTRIRGGTLHLLSGLDRLRRLSLEDTRVDDAALASLTLDGLQELVLRGTRVTDAGAAAWWARRKGCVVAGDFAYNEREAERARIRRLVLVLLVRRVVQDHPLSYTAPEEEIAEVLNRLFPPSTVFAGVPAGSARAASEVCARPWAYDLFGAEELVFMLRGLPYGSSVRITLPGGSAFTIPWLVRRNERQRVSRREAN